MSTLITHTVVFTGATLEQLHDQICKYAVKVGLAVEEAPAPAPAPEPEPAPETTEPLLTPPPAWAGGPVSEQEFVGSDGHLLWCAPLDFERWTDMLTESYNVTTNLRWIQNSYAALQEALVTMPPKLAAKAAELAAKHSYGAPEHLVAEYHYNRWMIYQEETVSRHLYRMKSLVPKDQGLYTQIEDIVDSDLRQGSFFRDRLFALAFKLIKEHGWKGPTNYNLAGTEFQKVAMDASKVKIDGCSVSTSGHGSLDTYSLSENLKAQ